MTPKQPPYAAEFTQPASIGKNKDYHYQPGDIAILPSYLCKELIEKNLAEVFSANDIFLNYCPGESEKSILFIHAIGGIGDIVAFSAVAHYFQDYIIQAYTHPRYFPILEQFASRNIQPKHFMAKVLNGRDGVSTLRRLPLEYAAISTRQNWYKAFFDKLGICYPGSEYYRPQMICRALTVKDTILICHRASCQIRSSRFQDFYIPAKEIYPDKQYFVYEGDLTKEDLIFIERETLGITILKTVDIDSYLKNLASMELVICTDTSAVHYREAIKKPCLAVFGAMTVESRTLYYEYTKSFNVHSSCPYQPCFAHELTKGVLCKFGEETNSGQVAPCLVGKSFQEQLRTELLNYKY